eukprot:g16560.t1
MGKSLASKRAAVHPQVRKFAERQKQEQQKSTAPKSNPFDTMQNKSRNRGVLNERRRGELRDAKKVNQVRNAERCGKLLAEYRGRNKKSVVDDKRFMGGSREENESAELHDKRFAKLFHQKQAKARKASKFDVDSGSSDALLTHGGKPLVAIGDEELEKDLPTGALEVESWKMTREEEQALAAANFGAGEEMKGEDDRTSGRSAGATSSDHDPSLKTRAEIFQEIVEKSKVAKQQELREQKEQERQLLAFDDGFQDLLKDLQTRTPADKYATRTRPDEYDRQMKVFANERVAKAQERLKTEEELAVEKAEKLAALEKGRLERAREDKSLKSKAAERRERKDANYGGADVEEDDGEEDENDESDESSSESAAIPLDAQTDSEAEDDADAADEKEDGDEHQAESAKSADGDENIEEEEDSQSEDFDFLAEQFGDVQGAEGGAEGESEWQAEEKDKDRADAEDGDENDAGSGKEGNEDEVDLLSDADSDEQSIDGAAGEEEDGREAMLGDDGRDSRGLYPRTTGTIDPMANKHSEQDLPYQVLAKDLKPLLLKHEASPNKVVKIAKRAVLSSEKQPDEDAASAEIVAVLLDCIWTQLTERGSFSLLYALEEYLIELTSGLGFTSCSGGSSSNATLTQLTVYQYFSVKMIDIVGFFDFHGKTVIRAIDSKQRVFESLHLAKMLLHFFPTTDVRHPLISPMLIQLDRLALAPLKKLFKDAGVEVGKQELKTALVYLRNVLFEFSNFGMEAEQMLNDSEQTTNPSPSGSGVSSTPDRYLPALFAVQRECDLLLGTTADSCSSFASSFASLLTSTTGGGPAAAGAADAAKIDPPQWLRHVSGFSKKGLSEASSLLLPLQYLKKPEAQIPVLDPLFHDPRDGILPKGDPNRSANRRLQREYNKERRNAAKELRKDAEFLRHVKAKEDERFVKKQEASKKRVRAIMGVEAQEIAQMQTSNATSMDTSLGSYKRRKKEKKMNPRLAGNLTNKDVGRK